MRFTQQEIDNMSAAEQAAIDSEELPQDPGSTDAPPKVEDGPAKKKRGRPPQKK